MKYVDTTVVVIQLQERGELLEEAKGHMTIVGYYAHHLTANSQ